MMREKRREQNSWVLLDGSKWCGSQVHSLGSVSPTQTEDIYTLLLDELSTIW